MASVTPPADLLGTAEVVAAARRIAGRIRPVGVCPVDSGTFGEASVFLALEFMQFTGTFKARGAANLATLHAAEGTMPDAGVVIASGGNAGLACAWAAQATGTAATVFVPATAPAVKVAALHSYGADVRLVGAEYADALRASIEYAQAAGALLSHAYDHPLIAAGAGTLALELTELLPGLDTIVVAVGGGGLFAGVAAATAGSRIKVVAVEPVNCQALNAAIAARGPVDVAVDSVAADALGARRVAQRAYDLAITGNVESVLVRDDAIIAARQALWDHRRVVVEHGGAAALAAVMSGAYIPRPHERVAVVLCGANTDPSDLIR